MIWRVQISAINSGTTFSMFLAWVPSSTHASLELRDKFKVALNLFDFSFFHLQFCLQLTLELTTTVPKNSPVVEDKFAKCINILDVYCWIKSALHSIRLWIYLIYFHWNLDTLPPNSINKFCVSYLETKPLILFFVCVCYSVNKVVEQALNLSTYLKKNNWISPRFI